MKERSLVAFTLLSQSAVGVFLVLALLYWRAVLEIGFNDADQLTSAGLILSGALILASLVSSITHLGSPLIAWRALSNLGASWLSREVLFALLFSFFGGLFTVLQYRGGIPWEVRSFLAILAGVVGLALVYSMGRLYQLRSVPAWNTWLTQASFFTSTFLLGSLSLGVLLSIQLFFLPLNLSQIALAAQRMLAGLLLLLLLVEFILIPVNTWRMAIHWIDLTMDRPLSQIYLLRLAPLFVGVSLAGVLLISSTAPDLLAVLGLVTAFLLALFSEVFGRTIFYASRQAFL